MSKPPSEKTQLANLRREIKRLNEEWRRASATATEYRIRATKAETEAADWKKRFDLLLARTPSVNGACSDGK